MKHAVLRRLSTWVRKGARTALLAAVLWTPAGCVNINIPIPQSLFPTGTTFVVTGRAAVIDQDGPCLVWLGDNGVTYHLFQHPRVSNEIFDQVTTAGVASRLELAVRTDLDVACLTGTIVQVENVLQVVE